MCAQLEFEGHHKYGGNTFSTFEIPIPTPTSINSSPRRSISTMALTRFVWRKHFLVGTVTGATRANSSLSNDRNSYNPHTSFKFTNPPATIWKLGDGLPKGESRWNEDIQRSRRKTWDLTCPESTRFVRCPSSSSPTLIVTSDNVIKQRIQNPNVCYCSSSHCLGVNIVYG